MSRGRSPGRRRRADPTSIGGQGAAAAGTVAVGSAADCSTERSERGKVRADSPGTARVERRTATLHGIAADAHRRWPAQPERRIANVSPSGQLADMGVGRRGVGALRHRVDSDRRDGNVAAQRALFSCSGWGGANYVPIIAERSERWGPTPVLRVSTMARSSTRRGTRAPPCRSSRSSCSSPVSRRVASILGRCGRIGPGRASTSSWSVLIRLSAPRRLRGVRACGDRPPGSVPAESARRGT